MEPPAACATPSCCPPNQADLNAMRTNLGSQVEYIEQDFVAYATPHVRHLTFSTAAQPPANATAAKPAAAPSNATTPSPADAPNNATAPSPASAPSNATAKEENEYHILPVDDPEIDASEVATIQVGQWVQRGMECMILHGQNGLLGALDNALARGTCILVGPA